MAADPEEALSILTDMFTPLMRNSTKLVLSGFSDLKQISDLSIGSEVTLRGKVTYVSPKRGDDLDIHFDLSTMSGKGFVVCEIQNADEDLHGKPLHRASDAETPVEVTGVLRIFPEHVYASAGPTLSHIFEIHPIDGVSLDGITMDCPGKESFVDQPSVHEITIRDDGTMERTSSNRALNDNIKVEFDGTDLTMYKPPFLNVNYVYSTCYLSIDSGSSFQDGKPYVFGIKGSNSADAVAVKSVVIPGTPAYETIKSLANNPPSGSMVVAALRSLDFEELFNSNYQVNFCPVYRIQ